MRRAFFLLACAALPLACRTPHPAGRWGGTLTGAGQTATCDLLLVVSGSSVRGSVSAPISRRVPATGDYNLYQGEVDGAQVRFRGRGAADAVKVDLEVVAEVRGDSMTGTFTYKRIGGSVLWQGTLVARRQ